MKNTFIVLTMLVVLPGVAKADWVTTTITTGFNPCAVAVNPVTNKIYVANRSNYGVTVIDGATNDTTNVAVGSSPKAVAVNPVTNKIYVSNTGSDNVTVIDGATNGTTNVAMGASPWAVAVNPVTNKIYVPNANSNNVTVIDGTTNGTTTVTVGTLPCAVAVNNVTNKIYVANYGSANVTVIDGSTNATTTVAVGTYPSAVGVNPVTNKIYVVNNNTNGTVTVIDGATNATTTVTAGTYPNGVGVNPVTNKVYVTNVISNSVTVIDEVPVSDTEVRAEVDTLPNHSTYLARPALAGKGVNRLTPYRNRIERVLQYLNTAQRFWNLANITSGAGTDSVRWSWTWGSDSLIKGENWVLAVPLESDASITNNEGLGSPFAGNMMVYPLYRIDPRVGVETTEVRGQKLEAKIMAAPNPFTSFASVPGHSSDRFALYDVSGRRVGTYKGDRIGEGLVPGVYFVRAEGGKAKLVRVVKVR